MLCCCERDEQTASRIMSDYSIDLGEWGVSSVPALMAKIVDRIYDQIIEKRQPRSFVTSSKPNTGVAKF